MMETDAERLQFVIRFAQMHLDTLRPGDWLNLRDDLGAFLAGKLYGRDLAVDFPLAGGDVMLHTEPPDPYEYPEDAFRRLQKETCNIVQQMVIRPRTPYRPRPGELAWDPIPIQVGLGAPSLDGLIPTKGQHSLVVIGATRDVFLFMVFMLLTRHDDAPSARILCCPECGTIFYRIGKQQYCSRVCTNRANVRTWRQREEVKRAEAERAHQRYVKRVKPERGRGPKITRRPRKGSTDHAQTPRES